MKLTVAFLERKMKKKERLVAVKLTEVFLEKRMAGRCKINRSILKKKEWLVTVKSTQAFFKKE